MSIGVVIVAAGRGSRAGAAGLGPKQYIELAGQTVLARAVAAFAGHAGIGPIQVVIHAEDTELYHTAIGPLASRVLPPVAGGRTRQHSVRAGLEALVTHAPSLVLIHDAARPFVDGGVIGRVIAALAATDGAIAALALSDTLKRVGSDDRISGTLDRTGLWRAQTPQGFRFQAILEAHRMAASHPAELTDDAAVAELAGLCVSVVEGSPRNLKITTPEDVAMAQVELAGAMEIRTGQGFDVHRFTAGDHVWLGGVRIPHTASLEGHSDADVALHALTDAILGAIADGDIGQHFPPSDPQWKGASSDRFLADAARRAREKGARIINVDVTVLAEAPRIGPHRAAMQARIADILGLGPGRVGIKATTTEGLGFTGRREGIAALAQATLELPRR